MKMTFQEPRVAEQPPPAAEIARSIRTCLTGLATASTNQLLNRVEEALAIHEEVLDRKQIRDVLDEMERLGDVTRGPGGRFASAPLRVVRCNPDEYLLVGTYPLGWLEEVAETGVGTIELLAELPRRLRVHEEQRLEGLVLGLDGRVLSAERWSGLDRAPAADESWLGKLDGRVREEGRYERDLAACVDDSRAWSYRPVSDVPVQAWRWDEIGESCDFEGGLVRYLAYGSFYRYLWIERLESDSLGVVDLNGADAARTQFALDRRAEAPLEVSVGSSGEDVEIELPGFLPPQEFKYLNAIARKTTPETPSVFQLRQTASDSLRERLSAQLGITFSEKSSSAK